MAFEDREFVLHNELLDLRETERSRAGASEKRAGVVRLRAEETEANPAGLSQAVGRCPRSLGYKSPGEAGQPTLGGVPARRSRRRSTSEVGREQTVPSHTNATGPAFASFVFRIEPIRAGT